MGRGSRHRKNSVPRKAARLLLALGIVAFAVAIFDFAYFAYEGSGCYSGQFIFSAKRSQETPIDSDECRQMIARAESHQPVDAAIAILAIVIVSGAAVRLSNANRRTKRVVLMVEVAVVAVGVVYTILLASVLR